MTYLIPFFPPPQLFREVRIMKILNHPNIGKSLVVADFYEKNLFENNMNMMIRRRNNHFSCNKRLPPLAQGMKVSLILK